MTVEKFIKQTETRLKSDLKSRIKYEIFTDYEYGIIYLHMEIAIRDGYFVLNHALIEISTIEYIHYSLWYDNLIRQLKEAVLFLYFY